MSCAPTEDSVTRTRQVVNAEQAHRHVYGAAEAAGERRDCDSVSVTVISVLGGLARAAAVPY